MAAPATQITGRTRSNDAYVFNGTVNVSRRYTVNGLNQYQAAVSGTQSTGFLYDDNGNLISDGTMCLFYDAENRLVFKRDWTADCANTSTTNQVALRYDPLGRLFEVGGPSGTTRFLYDGDELVMEFSVDALGTATLAKRYVHGPAADDPLVWYEGAGYGDPRFLHTDHQGSVVSIASGTSAAPLVINSYDEWGIPSASNLGRFQYTGQAWLPELGMYHYKARIYSPTLGRFLQTDPIGYDDQINLYAYVGNDPVNKTDPTGMCGEEDPKNSARCRINPDPNGDGSVTITFRNDNANGTTPDQYIDKVTANAFEKAVVESGVATVNVNSTSGGTHSPTSLHYSDRAVDVNSVNGRRVADQGASPAVKNLQGAMQRQLGVRENFGPARQTKTGSTGNTSAAPSTAASHRNHIHFSTQTPTTAMTPRGPLPVVSDSKGNLFIVVPEYP